VHRVCRGETAVRLPPRRGGRERVPAPAAPEEGRLRHGTTNLRARRLAAIALVLVCVPLLVEAVALDPAEVVEYARPVLVALRIILTRALPYLAAALSVAVLALLASRGGAGDVRPAERPSTLLCLTALALAGVAAFWTPSLAESILAGDLRVQARDQTVQIGWGGPLALNLPVVLVPVEEAGSLAERILMPRPRPEDVTARWVGFRTGGREGPRKGIQIVGSGGCRDVTAEFGALSPGEGRLFSHALRVGPGSARVRLRLAHDPHPPVAFFDASHPRDVRGLTVDTGGGDRAYRTLQRAGPGGAQGAVLTIDGEHTPAGYTVVVLSGEQWRRHDLSALLEQDGWLEVVATGVNPGDWRVRLVGDGPQSGSVPLGSFRKESEGETIRFLALLEEFDWGDLAPAAVVGVALVYEGAPGPFRLRLQRVRATPFAGETSGFALATTAAFDPGAGPTVSLMAVGSGGGPEWRAPAVFWLRAVAALTLLLGAVGPRAAWRMLVARPVALPAALAAGPVVALLLDPILRGFAEPRLEQMPVAMGLLALVSSWTALRTRRLDAGIEAPERDAVAAGERLAWVDALKGAAILGVIGIHVTADPAGLPFPAHPPAERVPALVGRAIFTGLNYQVFIIASFYLLARWLERRGQSYRQVLHDRVARILPPLVFWSLAFLAIRHAKALSFGYHEAYRRELASAASWLSYALLGSAQYHLHFLSLLLCLAFLYPLFRPAAKRPVLGLLLVVTLALWPLLDTLVHEQVSSPEFRQYALRATKILAYTGYGLFGFALWALAGRGLGNGARRGLLAVGVLTAAGSVAVLLGHALDEAAAGRWLEAGFTAHMARYLLPAAVFLIFFLVGDRIRWPAPLARLGALSLAIYVVHPAVLDLLEILQRGGRLAPGTTVAVNFVLVTFLSLLLVKALGALPGLRWTLGLEEEGKK